MAPVTAALFQARPAIGCAQHNTGDTRLWQPFVVNSFARPPPALASVAYAAWTPVLLTPNHPEYPAAHSCTSSPLGQALRYS